MQVESSSGYSVELLKPAFSITPERFNAIDMALAPGKFIGTVTHSNRHIRTYVYQSTIPSQPAEWVTVSGDIAPPYTPCGVAYIPLSTISL